MGLSCGNILRVKAVGCFRIRAPPLIFDGILNVTLSEEKVTQGNLEVILRLNYLNVGLTPRPHFLEGELIHLVDKAKIV